ncbi:hypothetical protein Forpe1208_v013774 [Fusarium oxysporum f. sp. rapae]|uniref:Uncharacterized protein n=1 Tax=Fusarium oxysporum f. sp. rapae TaxID=485398 RepID=A0A8J5NT13_FUSOX|nr:hypothetical protein Forpe1208_v013774 [Fusarium oxysporum f. sp. rapae]
MCTEHIGLPLCGNCGLDYDEQEMVKVYGTTWIKRCEAAKKDGKDCAQKESDETNALSQRCRNVTSCGPPWTGSSR